MSPKEHPVVAEVNTLKLAEHFVEAELALQKAKDCDDPAEAQKWMTIAPVHATLATADRAAEGIYDAKHRHRNAKAAPTGASASRRGSAWDQVLDVDPIVEPIGTEYTDLEWQKAQKVNRA